MRRYSTRDHEFYTDIDLREAKIYVTYMQNDQIILEKTNDDMDIEETCFRVHMTQEDTAKFAVGVASVQYRYILPDGVSDVSGEWDIRVKRTFKDEVLLWTD